MAKLSNIVMLLSIIPLFLVLLFIDKHSRKKQPELAKPVSKSKPFLWLLIIFGVLWVTHIGPLITLFRLLFNFNSVETESTSVGFALLGAAVITIFLGLSIFPFAVSNYLKTQPRIKNNEKASILIVIAYFITSVLLWVSIGMII